MAQLTPAPWKQNGIGSIYIGSKLEGTYKAVAQRVSSVEDARLIAAAPDLLAACEAFVTAYKKSLQLEKTDVALRLAEKAIAKAMGEDTTGWE